MNADLNKLMTKIADLMVMPNLIWKKEFLKQIKHLIEEYKDQCKHELFLDMESLHKDELTELCELRKYFAYCKKNHGDMSKNQGKEEVKNGE